MIDKHTPLKFVADKDQRLVGDGEMIVAQNVTITERGTGSGSILKTSKGFSGIVKDTGVDDLESEVVVIGQVTDEQRGFVYFFATHNSDSNHTEDMIVQYSHSSGKYKIVFKNTWLNFERTYFVKANVVSKSFQRDGVLQSVIYFTDNVNPPRKINVDRAIAGDYNNFSAAELDIALSTMRAAPTTPPTFRFESDDSVTDNNFEQNPMQYATQIIYKDGEESALSPYSKLAVSQAGAFGGLETTNYNVVRYTDNVCQISHNISLIHPDIKRVRLLARRGNSGGFFIVDEFDPNADLERDIYGGTKVYDKQTGEYKFFNNLLGQTISDTTAQKLYDNVPLKARGQALVDNRLMFSNYTEGYENSTIDPTHVSITPKYSDIAGGTSSYIDSDDAAAMFTALSSSNANVTIDLESATGIDGTTSFDAGTLVNIEFNFKPEFTITDSGNAISFNAEESDNGESVGSGAFTSTTLNLTDLSTTNKSISVSYVTPETFNSDELADFIQDQLQYIEGFFLDYTVTNQAVTSTTLTDTTVSCTARVFFAFGETSNATNDKIVFEPRIARILFDDVSLANQGSRTFDADPTSLTDVYVNAGNLQNEVTFSSISNTLGTKSISIDSNGAVPSFKSGANHGFGIVYYDKYGRSGFVNELGEVYVQSPPERSSDERGSVAMRFDLSHVDFDAPSWATSYQIVYSGSSISNVMQYTVGGAYPRRLTTNDGTNFDIDESVHNIYVSLRTLDQYRRDKDVLRDYSFTKGDKLRVLSHRNATDTDDVGNPLSSDSDLIEFDVIGVETFEGLNGDPIRKHVADASNSETNPHEGTFLVLTAPAVEAKAGINGGAEKYEGFDWYQITATDYNSGDQVNAVANRWNRETLVEIITPQKATSEKVYYEIGERKPIIPAGRITGVGVHGRAFTVVSGDVHFRPVAAKVPKYNTSLNRWEYAVDENPEKWVYTPKYIEDPSTSDLFESRAWDRGRAHSVFRDAAQVTRYNSITYSDPYADDTAVLKLSSFTPANINFFDLPTEHGACEYIEKLNDKLVAIQENKASLVGVNKGVIQTGSQAGLVSLSTQVLQNIIPYAGDHGTQNPESVLIRNGVVYFADSQRYAIVRLSERSYDVISDIDIKSEIEDAFDLWIPNDTGKHRIVCGYDPSDDIFYFTLLTQISPATFSRTYGFDEKGKFWQGKYTFYPDAYAAIKDYMLICDHSPQTDASDLFIFKMSEGANSNAFPPNIASPNQSRVTVVSNVDPSAVKAYESISLEADSEWFVSLKTSSGQETDNLSFSEKEDAFYAFVTGNKSTATPSRGHYIPVGKIASIDGSVLTMENSLRGIHIPKGYRVAKALPAADSFISYTQTVTSVDRPNKQITISSTSPLSAGDALFVFADPRINGDQIRGHYCEIKCIKTPSGTAREELYAINAKFVESKANHRKG